MLLFLVLGFFFIAVNLIGNVSNSNKINGIITDEENQENKMLPPEESWFNNNENPIYIDASATGVGAQNWTWARSQDWCQKGDGSYGNPYIIENVTINAGGAEGGIYIVNSKNIYFKIQNCTVYNAGNGVYDAGIKLVKTNNGTIFNNTCSNNGKNGIILYDHCENNTITGNTANNNTQNGIYLEFYCWYNTISGNTANNNNWRGICLYYYCSYNTISNNTANDNTETGICLHSNCVYNNISGNTASNNDYYGIYLYNTDSNTITKNTIKNCTSMGIIITDNSDGNTISNNLIAYNDYSVVIDTSDCNGNTFYHNNFTQNKYNAIDDGTSNNWDNGYIGNYWHNYTGTDDDDDGCGTPAYDISGTASNQDSLPFCDDNAYNENTLHVDDDGYYSWNWKFSSIFLWNSGTGTESDPYIIEDLTIDASPGNGILIENSNDVDFIIRNCTISDAAPGVYPETINGGIKLISSSSGQIYSNDLTSTTGESVWKSGICLYESKNLEIINNTCNGNTYGIFLRNSNENLIFNNSADSNHDLGIFLQANCHYNNITQNSASSNKGWDGIAIYTNSDNNNIINNTVINNTHGRDGNDMAGIRLWDRCSDNNIINNTLTQNYDHGVYLNSNCHNNTIRDNTAEDNGDDAIRLYDNCDDNKIIHNSASDTGAAHGQDNGVWIEKGCDNNWIINNTANNNGEYGINVENQASGIIINNNDVFNNSNGIRLFNRITLCEIFDNTIINNTGNGLYLQLASDWYVTDNLIYNNIFINNGENAKDDNYNNDWNNTVTGNFWDDYGDIDANDDGFGDNWYQITGSIYDKLPVWWDAPVVAIVFPSLNDLFGNDTIDYEITVERANLNDPDFNMWYVLDNGTIRKNGTFTNLIGQINYHLWNNFSTSFINITFYANDSRGWIGYMNVTIEKDVTIPIITIQKLGFFGASGSKALNFTIYKSGKILNSTWYRIYNISDWTDNYTFSGLSSWIEESLWDSLLNGTYTIQFFLNDSLNRLDFAFGIIIKDIYAPVLSIIDPSDNDVVGAPIPIFELNITEGNLHKIWYNLNNTYGNFTYINKIASEEWDNLGHGTVTITFWANDTAGNTTAIGVFVILFKDLIAPIIDDINAPLSIVYGSTAPVYSIDITEPNFDYLYYTLYDGTHLLTSSPTTELSGSIDQGLWNQLNNGQINITFIVVDEGENLVSDEVIVIREVISVVPSDGGGGGDDGEDDAEDLFPWYGIMPWYIQAMVTGAISATVGIAIKMSYNRFRKKKELEARMAAPTVLLKKKYEIIHHDFLTEYGKVEKKECRVGIAQVGLSKTGNLLTELYEMTSSGLMRIREDMLKSVSANIKGMIESAHENGVNILLFPEMTFDLNYKEVEKEIKKLAQNYDMYIITGGYHDIKTKQNICAVFGPEGIQWNQEKHTPATIHFGPRVFTEAIEIQQPPHKLHICATEYGRIAIAICRDFLDMDLRVEIKNCEPPVDLFFNPAYTPVTADFEATHFDARRSVYAYTFFANVAEYGGTIINTPEKDRTKRMIPPKKEGLIFKDVDLFNLRSERKKWEQRQSKEKRFIQSTR